MRVDDRCYTFFMLLIVDKYLVQRQVKKACETDRQRSTGGDQGSSAEIDRLVGLVVLVVRPKLPAKYPTRGSIRRVSSYYETPLILSP